MRRLGGVDTIQVRTGGGDAGTDLQRAAIYGGDAGSRPAMAWRRAQLVPCSDRFGLAKSSVRRLKLVFELHSLLVRLTCSPLVQLSIG